MADGNIELSAELNVGSIKVNTKELDQLKKDIAYIQKEIDRLNKKPISLMDPKELDKLQGFNKELQDAQFKYLKDSGNLDKLGLGNLFDSEAANAVFEAFGTNLDQVYNDLIRVKQEMNEPVEAESGNGILGALTKVLRFAGGTSLKTLIGGTKKAGSLLTGMFRNISKGATRGAMSMKRMIMGMVGARSLFTIISKATHSYLARNEELNQKMQTMWSTLGQLIGPVVEYIVNLILKLMGYFMSFIKLLGVNTDALKKQAKASNNAAKAQERQLASFDEMNKLSDSGGDGGSNYDIPEFDIGSLDDIGKNLAKKINDLLDMIDWEKLQLKVYHIVSDIVTQLNDFIANLNWVRLGWTIAQGINTALIAVYTFLTQFDWIGLATSLGDMLGTAISTIDWGKVAAILIYGTVQLLTSWFLFLSTTLETTDWQKVGDSLSRGLAKIDWKTALGTLAAAFLKALTEVLLALFLQVPALIGDIIAGIFEGLGLDSVAGFFKGISDALRDLGTWIRDNVFNPFINWFKSLFGIHSPSTVMQELGTMIIQGLLNGITSLVYRVKEIWENLKTNTINTWNTAKNWVVGIANNIKDSVVNSFTNAKDLALGVWTSFKTKVGEIFDGIWSKIKGVINSIIGGVESMANAVIDGINAMIRALNRVHFDIPGWVPGLGGRSFGFNLSQLGRIYIPRLAQGAVIPPNKEFMAILGDQKSGTNIEAPLDTIVEAFKQAQADDSGRVIQVTLKLDGKTLVKQLINTQNKLDFSFNR